MALAPALKPVPQAPSWNPFRCGGTALPIPLLLMVKLVALTLLLTNHVRLLPDPFLPFIPGLDLLLPPLVFQRILQTVFVASALALLFNRWVRASSLVLGLTILLAVVSSKAYYGNNKTFCGCLLFLTGLYEPKRGTLLLRWQLIVVYFGAGLNKILDADWRSGLFFENWAANRLRHGLYMQAAALLPPLALAKIMCWSTIIVELTLSPAFAIRRAWPLAIWINILFHSALLLFTGSTFTMFFYAMNASVLAFISWPQNRLLVIYDGDCGFCTRTRRFLERFDLEGTLHWTAYQSGLARRYGLTDDAARERLYLIEEGRIFAGYGAFQRMAMYNPASWISIAILVALPWDDAGIVRRVLVAGFLILFSPLFVPLGESIYSIVARNRHRLSSETACPVDRHGA
ncbi:MAG: DCC1-like thiol-disulfide oxidoreductase family protein [Bryobacteraceae bacterium]